LGKTCNIRKGFAVATLSSAILNKDATNTKKPQRCIVRYPSMNQVCHSSVQPLLPAANNCSCNHDSLQRCVERTADHCSCCNCKQQADAWPLARTVSKWQH